MQGSFVIEQSSIRVRNGQTAASSFFLHDDNEKKFEHNVPWCKGPKVLRDNRYEWKGNRPWCLAVGTIAPNEHYFDWEAFLFFSMERNRYLAAARPGRGDGVRSG